MQTGRLILSGAVFLALVASASEAQEPNEGGYVSRKEYDALKKELEEVKARLPAQTEVATPQAPSGEGNGSRSLNEKLGRTLAIAEGSGLGDTKMLIAGDASAGFFNPQGAPSTFTAEFNPMLLWQLNERLFFEGGLELALSGPDQNGEGSSTDVELDSAYLTYLLTDWALVGAGKFTVPFTAYHNHLDPSWINKLPFDPLVYADGGIAPDSGVGAFLTGAVPWGRAQFNYAVFLTNGPALITQDPAGAGSLNFDNFNDLNNNKALGFRVGYLPVPELEVGYSFEFSRPSPDGFETVHSQLHGVDLNYVAQVEQIKGQLTARAGWVWSLLGEATYDPTGALGFGPLRFENNRNGGYAEVAYRPTKVAERVLRNFEFALRYDRLDIPSAAPGAGTREQWTPGIDYWITPRTVLKIAYALAHGEGAQNVFALQFATGF
ncbi:MAG: OprO/OprP family phosphate-selective porin [Planctomycetes bacterium]|nr:OprO/OprP family phosphate-selective porin [Planctomycetota bacterium]